MIDGNEAWVFFEREQLTDALNVAVGKYTEAYDIHPRNREAVAGLNKVADAMLAAVGDDVTARRTLAEELQKMSVHYRKYAPVVEATQE
jgi:hypothetical protein